jgi:hypothetical protein
MGHQFQAIAFTDHVKALQEKLGSRQGYARRESGPATHDRLTVSEAGFIAERDSFYLASVGETGWPYIQHRGGPKGFLRVLDERTLGFADFAGNRQYVSVGNFETNDRVALFLMDYPNQTRLKLLGRARVFGPDSQEAPALLARLSMPDYPGRIERGILITVEAFDWNCPQHITKRFTAEDLAPAFEQLQTRIATLEAELSGLRATAAAAERPTGSTVE